MKKIYLKNHRDYLYTHRSGWPFAMSILKKIHSPRGILFDSFLEKKFVWGSNFGEANNNIRAYREPWIGLFHVPENVPEWFNNKQTPKEIFKNKFFIESLKYCKGFYCLSEYEKKIIKRYTDLPVNVIFHPTETPEIKFSFEKFISNKNKEIIQLGTFLRKLTSIFLLKTKNIKKSAVGIGPHDVAKIDTEAASLNIGQLNKSSVKIYKFLKNNEYDDLLSKNIVFVDLYDASANNAVIDCMVRNTPILIPPLPAVKEYLGDEYPFYFSSLEEASIKSQNFNIIKQTHDYLKNLETKNKLTPNSFIEQITESEIYKNLDDKANLKTTLKRIGYSVVETFFVINNIFISKTKRWFSENTPMLYKIIKSIKKKTTLVLKTII